MNTVTSEAVSIDAHTQTHFWLGVDGGGTNSRAVIIDETGTVRGEGRSAAANLLRVGLEKAVDHIQQAVGDACREAEIEASQIVAACVGLAGVSQAHYHRQMLDALKAVFPIPSIRLETDARVALAGATGNQPGIVIIAGTGSIACGINSSGRFARAGGWGPIMGDEGSGGYIGRRTLESVMMSYDFRGEATSMTGPVLRHFGVSSPPELTTVIYDSSSKEKGEIQSKIAQLSPIAVEAARQGDEVAIGILRNAASELAKTAVAVIDQLNMERDIFRVSYVGGVFEAGELILKPLREEIQKVAPNAEVAPPLDPPVIGAAKMALARGRKSVL